MAATLTSKRSDLDESPAEVAVADRRLRRGWTVLAAGASVPIGMSIAAVVTSSISSSERVAIAAWTVVGVVGTASVVAAATVLRGHRPPKHRERRVEHANGRKREAVVG